MELPSKGQVAAAAQWAGTAVGTIATISGAVGVLSQDQVATFVTDIHAVIDDLVQLFGDGSKLILFIAPIATIWLAKIGYSSASPKKQIASVQALPTAQVTVTDPKLAEGIPGVKVEAKS